MKKKCPDCGGTGYARVWNEELLEYDRRWCERCGGTGEIGESKGAVNDEHDDV